MLQAESTGEICVKFRSLGRYQSILSLGPFLLLLR